MSSDPDLSAAGPSHEEISHRARQLWETAGAPADRDLEFWLAAESTLRRQPRHASQTAGSESIAPKRTATRRR